MLALVLLVATLHAEISNHQQAPLLTGEFAGNGIVMPHFSRIGLGSVCCIYAPAEGFTLYDSPLGGRIGKLQRIGNRETDDQFMYKLFVLDTNGDIKRQVQEKEVVEVGYEAYALSFDKRERGFVKVLAKETNYWLNVSEIERYGFECQSWRSFLIANSGQFNGYYAKGQGLTLREPPRDDTRLIAMLKGNLFQIIPTKEVQGLWCKVHVRKFKAHPCETNLDQSEVTDREFVGWARLVDDHGNPDVWFYPRGC